MSDGLTPDELECIRSVKRAADGLGLGIIAVGASARQLVFDWPYGIRIHRTTTDWDFGVRVPDWDAYGRLKGKLIEEAFAQGGSEQRLIHRRTGVRIDLVPFGGLESDNHIRWPDSRSEMNVFGFSEAFDTATTVRLEPGLELPVATVPLLIALKFIALADRNENSGRHLSDLWHFAQEYVLDGRESELYESPLDSVRENPKFSWEFAPALLMGYDLGRACRPATVERLLRIIEPLTDPYAGDVYSLISGRPLDAEQEGRNDGKSV